MNHFDILRIDTSSEGTYGVIRKRGSRPFAVTMELPWRENQTNISCIPAGVYRCRRTTSPNHPAWGEVWELQDVPGGRTKVYLHPANFQAQILGCIAVAEEYAPQGVGDSQKGFKEFMALTKGCDDLILTITEHYAWDQKAVA